MNTLDPFDSVEQEKAFAASTLQCAAFLQRGFVNSGHQFSRDLDPIVGVSFTGAFTFFAKAFGVDWLRWWQAGRPKKWGTTSQLIDLCGRYLFFEEYVGTFAYLSDAYEVLERWYLLKWREIIQKTLWDYCDRHNLKRPNRFTTLKPEGSGTLLTGVGCCGHHAPKGWYYIRRMTFAKNDPIALAAIDYGYSIVPSQSDKDEDGKLLNDPFDPRCTEWLVEVPVEEEIARLFPEVQEVSPGKFSALAQFDFYMQVQKHYVSHNCFARNTEFLTSSGVKTFDAYEPGDVVQVLNAQGDWVDATVVRTNEPRVMYEVLVREGKTGKEKRIVATGCHRFPTRRASGGDSVVKIRTTDQLKPGHRLVINSADLPDVDEEGIRHGIAFGDGSLYKNSDGVYVGCQLYLCGAKRLLQVYFEAYERTYERSEIDQTRIYGLPVHYKSLPSSNCSQSYLAGFIAGLLATDGNIHHSVVSISSSRSSVAAFLIEHLPRLAIKVTSCKWYESSAYKEGSGAFQIVVSKATFPENLILRPHHLEHFQAHDSQPCQWRVVNVTELPEKQYGWCVMEPETNHFTLSDNILVMNTSATIELEEPEIEPLAQRIYQAIQNDEGYISAALLARFEASETFPRLPFEPISKERYQELMQGVLSRRKLSNFQELIDLHSEGLTTAAPQDAACDSGFCELKASGVVSQPYFEPVSEGK